MIHRWWFRLVLSLVVSALIIFFAAGGTGSRAAGKYGSLEQFTSHIDGVVPKLMDAYDIPGAGIALVKEGKSVWTGVFGYADLETQRRMTVDTICRMESISKSVTAWGVMRLVEQGKIDLDTPVRQYITSWEFPKQKSAALEDAIEGITARRLLSASAGMPLGFIGIRFSPADPDIPSLEDRLSGAAVLFQEPGTSFFYSNAGYYLLELLIEEATGRDFAEYMQNEILVPLGMERSDFTWRDDFDPAVPKGYLSKDKAVPVYVYPDKAAGGLFAPIDDIVSFVVAGMPEYSNTAAGVLTPESIEAMYAPRVDTTGYYGMVFDSYGFGHFIETLPTGEKAVSHGGQGTGWMTQFYSVPETGDGIVIITNSSRSWPFFSYLFSDWAEWNGFGSVGFGLVARAKNVLWVFLAVLLALVVWRLWVIIHELIAGSRGFRPFSKTGRVRRLIFAVLCIGIAAGLLWIFSLPYFFLFSVFPIASMWLMYVLAAAAFVFLLSALLPRKPKFA